jgi:hypothetical protein
MICGFLQNVRSEYIDDVSELAVGPIFTGHMTIEGGANSPSSLTSSVDSEQ